MIQYILKALLEDDSIFVNDLGTFTKTYQPARFDGDTLLPPQYVVTLNTKDDQPDDTGFINLVCREKQCRITEAAMEINRWVEELKNAIQNNKEVGFDNFGTFSLNNKGVISFVCDHIDELNHEFEGMGVVKLGAMDEEVQEVQEVQEVKEEEERRLQEEAEQRLREAEEQERLAKEAEERRLQEEAEQRLREAEEQERLAKEAEERRLQEEAEQRLREAEEQERLAKEAEERRLQEEAEQRLREAEEEKRLQEEAEQRLREAEAEEKRLQEEAEQRLREAEAEEMSHSDVTAEPETEPTVERVCASSPETETTENIETEDIEPVDNDKQTEDEPTDEVAQPKKRRSLWWLFVLIILIALGALGYLFRQQLLTVFNNLKEKITAPKEAVVTEEPETVAEDTIAYEEVVEEDTLAEPEVYTPEVVRTTASGNYPVIRFEQGHYYVIAGSLPSEQDAVRHIKQRNLDQYEPKLVMQNGVANLRVCIGIFDTEEEAETFAKNINPKYWVLK